MTDQQEEKVDSFYEDYMQVLNPKDNYWLKFKKVCRDRNNYGYAVEISLEDRNNATSVVMATYYHAKWTFSAPMFESQFWQIVKAKPTKFRKIFDKMRTSFPKKESFFTLFSMTRKQRKKMKELKKQKREIEKNISKK